MNQPRHVTRAQLIESMQGFPILGVRPKGFRAGLRALAAEIGLSQCAGCLEYVVVGENPGAELQQGKFCSGCARLRVDDLPPEAA